MKVYPIVLKLNQISKGEADEVLYSLGKNIGE
jgi:hypothetical protein